MLVVIEIKDYIINKKNNLIHILPDASLSKPNREII